MNYAMNPPWWGQPGEARRGRRGRGPRSGWAAGWAENREDRGGPAGPGRRGRPRGPEGHDFFGPEGPFGTDGPFGPRGPFGPGGPFGMAGPFGPGGPFGRGRGRRRGDVREAILALLAEAPLNGYQIIQTIAERTGGIWKPSPGAVYPALSQLEDEGLIEAFDNGGQKAFRLTEAGRAVAERIEVKPWETVVEANMPRNAEGVAALWQEFGALAAAAKSASASGSPEQVARVADLLAEARRGIYGVLAADEPGDALR